MKKIVFTVFVILPLTSFSQTFFKVGSGAGNRWNETLTSQTIGRGFRLSGEQFIVKQFSIGAGISYFSFNPNKLVNIRFNSYSLLCTYYFNTKKLQPYLGTGAGYTRYTDKTMINLGNGNSAIQKRDKNYSIVSPYLGLQYCVGKKDLFVFFVQINADFIPIANIQPIGFISLTAGIGYHFSGH